MYYMSKNMAPPSEDFIRNYYRQMRSQMGGQGNASGQQQGQGGMGMGMGMG